MIEPQKIYSNLGFDTDTSISTLFFTDNNYNSDLLRFEERLILNTAKKLNASAVYFRRFANNQSSKPQLFIFDNSNGQLSDDDIANIHRKIWSSGIVPLYYVFDKTNINIYDARKQVKYNDETGAISINPFKQLSLVKDSHNEYQKFSAQLFANGTFWEQKEVSKHFLNKESAENKLIEGLKNVRKHFIEESGLERELANKLLVLSILVKYLEERKDEQGNHVFPSDYFKVYKGATSFCEVLKSGKTVNLFDELSKHFNGKIFELDNWERYTLENTSLNSLANYLGAKHDGEQLVIWPLYSFEYLPVELISRIYEEFIDQRKDAVFTPIHLAHLMVDECMPISQPKDNYKVIDISCGSGVFLVSVFKRLVQWWQKKQFDKTGQLCHPEIKDLKQILRQSVYGVDIEETSVRLSVFSLSIALCDLLTPTEIWKDLRFDNLREKNIYHGDFFEYLQKTPNGQFDLVIGNPPFEDKKKDFKLLFEQYSIQSDYHIPRNQIAMLFLQQAMKLLKPDGLLSLVMPSGPLLYNDTLDFRKEFFSRYEVPQIIDLSELRNASVLFEKTIATAVVFACNKKPKPDNSIAHICVKRTKATNEKLYFEIDHYDINYLSQEIACHDPFIWKANLMGGNQLYYLVNRLAKLRSLGEYLKEKKENHNWVYGEGYIVSTKTEYAEHLTGKTKVETKDFTEDGVLRKSVETETKFLRSRKSIKEIFTSPHLLIKEVIGKNNFIIKYFEEDIIFKHRILGIHAPKGQEELKKIESVLKKNYKLFKLLILSSSAEAGISRSGGYVVLKKDFLNLPYPLKEKVLELSENETIIRNDVLNYKLEELSKGEKAAINTQTVSKVELEEFGKILCTNLNPIYQAQNRKFKALKPIHTISYTCFPFAYGNAKISNELKEKLKDGDLSDLIENKQESVLYRRILRLYKQDIIYLIKPNTLRYWLKSVALRDASDISADLINSGY
ncbi:class I SAM-dependent DNA methyltransferase [Carboxylicivirga sp. M1479]|uniref:HsdM family class I SAM-dependent methyltransferase n=1 Tax=Carboxylicivirga sp. M1479 TaxID=2594476 RepID=UPI001177CAD2|nr:N-6 DNA methylase [Carboxylicivirga sp. M1479]TRX71715.1 N-6 DNA methylase [Carboxylicivirga sp. M1479]